VEVICISVSRLIPIRIPEFSIISSCPALAHLLEVHRVTEFLMPCSSSPIRYCPKQSDPLTNYFYIYGSWLVVKSTMTSSNYPTKHTLKKRTHACARVATGQSLLESRQSDNQTTAPPSNLRTSLRPSCVYHYCERGL